MFNRKLNMIQSCSSWRRQLSWGCPSQIHAFYSYRDELAVQGKILFRANRVIVPAAIRSEMLKKIHASHLRWHWGQPSASKENPLLVCNDGSYQGPCLCLLQFLWVALSDRRASSVITSLKSQFSRHGIPNIVRSDNGSQFPSSDLKTFAPEWDFEDITSSPYYARSNGKVEKAVNTAKRILKKAMFDHKDPYLALLDWRNTPTKGFDSSPVQRLMGRRTRTLLPTSTRLLRPKLPKSAKDLVTN